MKKMSRLFALLLVVCMILSILPTASAYGVAREQRKVASTSREGAQIPVYIIRPNDDFDAEKTYSLALLLHGHGGNHNEWGGYDEIANRLAGENTISVELDFPGCGESTESFQLNTMTNMKHDVLDVLAYMKQTYKIDKVSVMGYSMGGRIVLELLAEELAEFDNIAFVAPAEDTEDLKALFGGSENWTSLKQTAEANGYAEFTTIYGQQQQLSKQWFADLEKYSDGLAEAAAAKFDGNAMVVYATDDAAVSPSVSQGVADAFACPVLNTYTCGHSYSFYGTDAVVKKTVDAGVANFFAGKAVTYVYKLLFPAGNNTTKYGHVDMNVSTDAFLQNFAYGDIVRVVINNKAYDMPVCSDYTDVATGARLVRAAAGKSVTTLAINYGQFGVLTGLAVKTDSGYAYASTVTDPVYIYVTMQEAGGYLVQWQAHHLERTNVRADYAQLTDAEFANFREVTTTGIRDNTLYRSSSPINPELGRNTYADAAAKAAGVKTFINLADTEETAKGYAGFAESYYAKQKVVYLGLPVAFNSEEFKTGLAAGYRFIANNSGPYLIHCTEGKDRAGIANAVLECLMGATYKEVLADYMKTYDNYYGVKPGEARYDLILADNLLAALRSMFSVTKPETADLREEAEAYLREIGLTDAEIKAIKTNLGIANPFKDIKEISYFYYFILDLYERGIVKGMSKTTFDPGATLTRAEAVTFLYRLAGSPPAAKASCFTDVPAGQWYTSAIAWAKAEGITNGVGYGQFGLNDRISRAQMATILYRMAGSPAVAEASTFTDVAAGKWYTDAIAWAQDEAIINGMSATSFEPFLFCTRAQAAKMLCVYDAIVK